MVTMLIRIIGLMLILGGAFFVGLSVWYAKDDWDRLFSALIGIALAALGGHFMMP